MSVRHELSVDGRTLTIRVPFALSQRGGRKLAVLPDGSGTWPPPRAKVDNTLVKALARAFRWRQILESGRFTSLAELARHERITQSYLCRILRLSLLAPEIVEAILNGRNQAAQFELRALVKPLPAAWECHRSTLAFAISRS